MLGVQNLCTEHQIQFFDWLISESEHNNCAQNIYDRKARYIADYCLCAFIKNQIRGLYFFFKYKWTIRGYISNLYTS